MATRTSQTAAEKAARMKAVREAQQPSAPPPAAGQDEPSPAAGAEAAPRPTAQREEGLPTVRLSVDLAQPLYDQLDDWMRTAARASGRTRFHRVLVIRALVRELFVDADLAERVRRRVQDDMQRST